MKRPKKLWKASELEREHSERREKDNSPSRPREDPEDPNGEAAVPGGVHDVQERSRNVRHERVTGGSGRVLQEFVVVVVPMVLQEY